MYFEIQADDPVRAITFYSDVFGWKFFEEKGLDLEYWRIEAGELEGGLLRRPAKAPPMESGAKQSRCAQISGAWPLLAGLFHRHGSQYLWNFSSGRKCGRLSRFGRLTYWALHVGV
jgi:hypothetical protein